MATLLHIDSSPMGEYSVTRALTQHFTAQWQAQHPDGKVITRDITTSDLPVIVTTAQVMAVYTPEAARTPEQTALLATSDALLAELDQADEYLFGVPMHNFSIPAVLKLWIDQICRAGKTFAYVDGRPQGLLKNKKATVIMASGGMYDKGTATESLNHVEPYLRSVLGFIGVTDTKFISVGGAAALRDPATDRVKFMLPHLASVEAHFAAS